jgi:hypothetical protein
MAGLTWFNWYQYGYAMNLAEGEILSVVNSGYGHHMEGPLNKIIGVGSNMGLGCSGGPWFHWDEEGLFANGLNSFSIAEGEGACAETEYGPYFGKLVWDFYQDMKTVQFQ